VGAAVAERLPLRRRLLYSLIVFVLALALMEGGLQVASRVAQGRMTRGFPVESPSVDRADPALASAPVSAPTLTILCVGDSHTYGLPLPEEESYPAQLEAALAAHHPQYRFRVVNLGIPGINSAFAVNRLERQLFQVRPQLVIVWVGINNIWNVIESSRWRGDDRWRSVRRTLMRSKLFRLASIAWFSATGHQYDDQYDNGERGGWYEGEQPPSGLLAENLEMPDPAPGLAHDMGTMVALTRAVDTPILFVAYPMAGQQAISRVIRSAGAQLGVGVVDATLDLERAKRDGHSRAALIDERSGPHPAGLLYRYVVESLEPEVIASLEAWHDLDFAKAAAP